MNKIVDSVLELVGRTPMGSFGEPEDLGPLAVYLASDAAIATTDVTRPQIAGVIHDGPGCPKFCTASTAAIPVMVAASAPVVVAMARELQDLQHRGSV